MVGELQIATNRYSYALSASARPQCWLYAVARRQGVDLSLHVRGIYILSWYLYTYLNDGGIKYEGQLAP